MAPPHGEAAVTTYPSRPTNNFARPPKLSNNNLNRSVSDFAFELSKVEMEKEVTTAVLPPISEAEDAKCECCGMSEEYTPGYVKRVRDKFCGKWICGLCSEAVKEEMVKNGGNTREALDTHMTHCVRFNQVGRPFPVLCQAQAMREILKKSSKLGAKSMNSRDIKGPKNGISRSSSCIPAITREINDLTLKN